MRNPLHEGGPQTCVFAVAGSRESVGQISGSVPFTERLLHFGPVRAVRVRGVRDGSRASRWPGCESACKHACFSSCRISAGICAEAGGRLRRDRQHKMPICRVFLAGATGLEPATSGVTGRSWRFRAERGFPAKAGLSTLAWRGFAGAGGNFRRPRAGSVRDVVLAHVPTASAGPRGGPRSD